MAQINPRTFADAIALGDGVYELILTNWGNLGVAQDRDHGSIRYPPIASIPFTSSGIIPGGAIPIEGDDLLPPLSSLSAIAIAPRSDLDRCILHFAGLPNVPAEKTTRPGGNGGGPYGPFDSSSGKVITVDQGFVNYGGVLETEQFLSVGAPLIGSIQGPISVRADPYAWFTDSYRPVDPAGMQTFGTALNSLATTTGPGFFVAPQLRLLLYFNGKGALPPPRRAPAHFVTALFDFYPFAGAVPPQVYPIMGRRRVTITARNTEAFAVTLYVRGVFSRQNAPFSSVQTNAVEADLVAPISIPANGSAVVSLDHPGVPFLTLMAGLPGGGLGLLDVSVDCFD